jgi:hypothetical protein
MKFLQHPLSAPTDRLFVTNWTGGAHCCTTLLVFEAGSTFRLVAKVDGGNFEPVLKDVDGDGKPEILVEDDFLAYRFSSFASSATGSVVLKESNGGFVVAHELMKRRPLNPKTLAGKMRSWRAAFARRGPDWPPPGFIQTLTDLIFSGNGALANQFIDDAWPMGLPGKEEFLDGYREALSESRFYPEAAAMLAK